MDTHQSIIDALDLLATGKPKKTNGKITAVHVAAEADISKATLYRYFKSHPKLEEDYKYLRKNDISLSDDAPGTILQAYKLLEEEVKKRRSELSKVKKEAEQINNLKSHQIQVLWMENERLQQKLIRLQEKSE